MWKRQSLSHVRFFATPWTVACQPPLFLGFPRQEYWSGKLCPPPGDFPKPGIEPRSPALLSGKNTGVGSHALLQGIFLTQGSNPGLLHYHLSNQGNPIKIKPWSPGSQHFNPNLVPLFQRQALFKGYLQRTSFIKRTSHTALTFLSWLSPSTSITITIVKIGNMERESQVIIQSEDSRGSLRPFLGVRKVKTFSHNNKMRFAFFTLVFWREHVEFFQGFLLCDL